MRRIREHGGSGVVWRDIADLTAKDHSFNDAKRGSNRFQVRTFRPVADDYQSNFQVRMRVAQNHESAKQIDVRFLSR